LQGLADLFGDAGEKLEDGDGICNLRRGLASFGDMLNKVSSRAGGAGSRSAVRIGRQARISRK